MEYKLFVKGFIAGTVLLTSMSLHAAAKTTSAQDLDALYAAREAYSAKILLLTAVASGKSVPNTPANKIFLQQASYIKTKDLKTNDILEPFRDIDSITICPSATGSMANLCFGDSMKKSAKNLIPGYAQALMKTEYVYQKSLSLVRRDQMSERHLKEILERPAREAKANQSIEELKLKIQELQGPSMNKFAAAGLLAIGAVILLIFAAVPALGIGGSMPLVTAILGILGVSTGIASIGTLASSLIQQKNSGIYQLEEQLAALQESRDALFERKQLDQRVLEILSKADQEKSQNSVNTVLP